LRTSVRDQLVATELIGQLGGEQELIERLTAKADELGVEVSPRYGTWDGIVLEQSSGSISTPESAPIETPAG
jgi:hypothetical protein